MCEKGCNDLPRFHHLYNDTPFKKFPSFNGMFRSCMTKIALRPEKKQLYIAQVRQIYLELNLIYS